MATNNPVSSAGILSVLWCGLDTANTLAGKHAFMLYYLAPAMRPRFLLTVDEAGDPLPVAVRVGLAVDTVAQAGQPKSITGTLPMQSHALLGSGFRMLWLCMVGLWTEKEVDPSRTTNYPES
jgi:26S proteasome regulatory subunit N1